MLTCESMLMPSAWHSQRQSMPHGCPVYVCISHVHMIRHDANLARCHTDRNLTQKANTAILNSGVFPNFDNRKHSGCRTRPPYPDSEEFSMKRRQFIAGAAAGSAAAASTVYSPLTIAKGAKFELEMVTSWPTSLETLHGTAVYLSEKIEAATDGDVTVTVHPAGSQDGVLEVFCVVASGVFALGHTAPYDYIRKDPTHALVTTQTFGLAAPEQNAWMISGDGEDLWNELDAKSNLSAFTAGQTGPRTGGWFNKK